MKNPMGILFGVAMLVAIAIVGFQSPHLPAGIGYQDNMAEAASKTALALLAITLFVERGMALINAIVYGDSLRDADIALMKAENDDTAGAAVDTLAKVMSQRERLRLFGSFLAGLLISAAGVRTLTGLLDVGTSANPFLAPVDIVLTAALIAGGSNGLAFLLQLVRDRLAPPADPANPNSAPAGSPEVNRNPALEATGPAEGSPPAPSANPGASRTLRARLTTG